MEDKARIGYMPVRVWGCPSPAMWVYRLGAMRAKRLMLTGDLITGKQAYEWGLATEVEPLAKLDATVKNLADRIAGPQGLLLIAVLIGVCVPLFNIGAIWPMARYGQRGFGRELCRNPLVIATASGLLANLVGLHIPSWSEPTLQRIGAASLALGLMAAGAGMQLATLTQAKTLGLALLIIRHLLTPLMAWGLAHWFALDVTQTSVLLAFSALPTASSCYVLATRMGYDGAFVAGLVTLSTLLGMVSLPFALGVLR
jgi:predicted permease